MTYAKLKEQVLKAKHLHETHMLSGTTRTIVYYIYAEILECIEKEKFWVPKRHNTARDIQIFQVKTDGKLVYVNTLYRHNAEHIKCFHCISDDEAKSMLNAIESAAELIGLKSMCPRYEGKHILVLYATVRE